MRRERSRERSAQEAKIACTIYVGDNYFHEHKDDAIKAILDAVGAAEPQVLVAGPAFNSGRYGLSCVEICNAVAKALEIPCLTAMHEENPGVDAYRELGNARVYLSADGGDDNRHDRCAGDAWRNSPFVSRDGEEIGSALKEGYIGRGIQTALKKPIGAAQSARSICCSRKSTTSRSTASCRWRSGTMRRRRRRWRR